MSHATKINVNEDLEKIMTKCRSNTPYRCIQMKIFNEQIIPVNSFQLNDKLWQEEYDKIIEPLLETEECCYILYNTSVTKNEWIFLSFIPDFAHYRDKMIYAATRSNVKEIFGSYLIKTDIEGSNKSELNLKGYNFHLKSEAASPPLTRSEIEKNELKAHEAIMNSQISCITKTATLPGIAFPIEEKALNAIEQFFSKKISYVYLTINCDVESIELSKEGRLNLVELGNTTDLCGHGYHLLNYQHDFNNDRFDSSIFVYVMPGYKASIKERMIYPSCKRPFLDFTESYYKKTFDKKIEIEELNLISEEYLKNELHPSEIMPKVSFARPKPQKRH